MQNLFGNSFRIEEIGTFVRTSNDDQDLREHVFQCFRRSVWIGRSLILLYSFVLGWLL